MLLGANAFLQSYSSGVEHCWSFPWPATCSQICNGDWYKIGERNILLKLGVHTTTNHPIQLSNTILHGKLQIFTTRDTFYIFLLNNCLANPKCSSNTESRALYWEIIITGGNPLSQYRTIIFPFSNPRAMLPCS